MNIDTLASNYHFIPGLNLNRKYFFDIIKPLISKTFPDLTYSAALIGYGSDVLGCDNPTSMDHNWGPRCQLFLNQNSISLKEEISDYLSMNLPFEFLGFPTNYTDPRSDFTQSMLKTNTYPLTHLIEIHEIEAYFASHLGIKKINDLTEKDWIELNDQALLELTEGEVFHDGLNKLNIYRERLRFYPSSVFKMRMASLWMMVANEEAFIGRCIELNDYIGLKIISSRVVNTLLKILFYLEREYIPYSKWFGTKLKKLQKFELVDPLVSRLLRESNPEKINMYLSDLYRKIVEIHNQQNELPKLDNSIHNYYDNNPENKTGFYRQKALYHFIQIGKALANH